MRIYCAHAFKTFTKTSNYYKCHICMQGWYTTDATPLVVIGQTDPGDVNPKYLDNIAPPDLSLKKFIRCIICKDLLGKRQHILCNIKLQFKKFSKQNANGQRPYMIAVGLAMILLAF